MNKYIIKNRYLSYYQLRKSIRNIVGSIFISALLFSCGGESSSGSSSSSSSTATANLALSITATPTRILSGSDITFNVKVQNNGDATSRATTLGFYRSSDAAISNSDTSLNSSAITVPSIAADSSLDIARSFAGHHSGTMHYGACLIDASGENTCSNAILIEVIPVDLSIASLNVTPNRIYSGGNISFSGEIQNSGETASTFATLKIYRSNDAEISNSDTSLKSLSLASIATGASINIAETIGGHSTGTMYYGVCVVDVSSETNTGNNCTTGIAVDIIPVALYVASFNVTPTRIFSGGALNISGHLQNDGAEVNNSATLGFYRSSDSNISTSDTSIDISIISVASDASFDISRSITGHNTGTMYYGACVVTTNGETSCSTGVAITIIPPDLLLANFDANPKSIQAIHGTPIKLTGEIQNNGSTSAATNLNIYISTINALSSGDTPVEFLTVPSLAPNATYDLSGIISSPSPHPSGTMYYGACVTAVSGETVTDNNCQWIAVEVITPDLVVATLEAAPNRILSGSNIALQGKVQNIGRGDATRATLRFYRSVDNIINPSDDVVLPTSISLAKVTADASLDFSVRFTGHNSGTMYYGACIVDASGEVVTNNNCLGVAVEVIPVDLVVTLSSITPTILVVSGDSINFSGSIQNNGDTTSTTAALGFYRSVDATISTSDFLIGTLALANITADASIDFSGSGIASGGDFYYGACAINVRSEVVTNNNCSSSRAINAFPITNTANVSDDATLQLDNAYGVTTAQVGNNHYAFVIGHRDDGVSVFRIESDGSLVNVDNTTDGGDLELDGAWSVTTAQVGGVTYLYVIGNNEHGISVFRVANNGSLVNVDNIQDDGTLYIFQPSYFSTAQIGSNTYLFAGSSVEHGVSVFRIENDGSLVNTDNTTDNATLEILFPTSAATTQIGSNTYLFITGATGMSAFQVSESGMLTNVANIGGGEGGNDGSHVTTAQIGSSTYLFVGEHVANAISVFEVLTDGSFDNIYTVRNDSTKHLNDITALTTTQIGSNTYLFVVNEGDDGLSVFRVEDNGSLVNVANFQDNGTLNINHPLDINTTQIGNNTYLFAVGRNDDGVSVFRIDNEVITGEAGAILSRAKNVSKGRNYPSYLSARDANYYRMYLPLGDFTFATEGSLDTVCTLYNNSIANLTDDTGETNLGTDNNGGTDNNCSLTYNVTTAGYYYLKINGNAATDTGSYTLTFP